MFKQYFVNYTGHIKISIKIYYNNIAARSVWDEALENWSSFENRLVAVVKYVYKSHI